MKTATCLEDIEPVLKAQREKCAEAVPTNWLDPLLTGKDAVIGEPPYFCNDIEKLLLAIRNRIEAVLNAK